MSNFMFVHTCFITTPCSVPLLSPAICIGVPMTCKPGVRPPSSGAPPHPRTLAPPHPRTLAPPHLDVAAAAVAPLLQVGDHCLVHARGHRHQLVPGHLGQGFSLRFVEKLNIPFSPVLDRFDRPLPLSISVRARWSEFPEVFG